MFIFLSFKKKQIRVFEAQTKILKEMQLSPMLKRSLAPYDILWKNDWCVAYALFGTKVCSLSSSSECKKIREWHQQPKSENRISFKELYDPFYETDFDKFFT